MKASLMLLAATAVSAGPITILRQREVPQEHSHERILRKIDELLALDNPNQIQASVFGLLGAAAAAGGAGLIEDPDCLQQATADQAFTNAKAAGDVDGLVAALIFRALERNTGQVGLESVLCESLEAVNPEIAVLQQHQDPAADGAAELNKAIAEELVRQILAVGGDPLDANVASTFAPGELGDPTAAGNTCNDENDVVGCIETLGLRVDDLSAEEIAAIVDEEDGAAVVGNNVTDVNNVGAVKACNATQLADQRKNKKNKNKVNKKKQNVNVNNNNKDDLKAQLLNKLVQKQQIKDAKAVIADLLQANKKLVARRAATATPAQKRQILSFGACAAPTIVFGLPSDGRQEEAFEATNLNDFPHGSALNIKVIADFICDQLVNKCKADEEAVALCDQAAADAAALKAQAAADAFNAALGF